MTWPFDNNTNIIIKKLAALSLQAEKRRNIMVIISVALAAFLISFTGCLTVSLLQMQNNQVADTYEAVYSNLTEQMITVLKEQPGVARIGSYYLLGEEHSSQGFTGSFVYADKAMLYIGRQQMNLTAGSLPEKGDEITASKSWLKKYAPNASVGDTVVLDTDNFHGRFTISGITDALTAEGAETYPFLISNEFLKQYANYNPSGYRAYTHLKNDTKMTRKEIEFYCEKLSETYGLSSPSYNSPYFIWISGRINPESIPLAALLSVIVLTGGCVVIQSIFRISVIEKIQCFGQFRTLGATKRQITLILKKEGYRLGWIGITIGTLAGIAVPLFLIPDGFDITGYAAVVLTAVIICFIMIRLSIRKPIKMAAGISPIEAAKFTLEQPQDSRQRKSHKKITPFSLALSYFSRDKKKTAGILLSLSIGGVLLLVFSTLLLTYSPDTYARKYFPNGDYKIYIDSEKDSLDILYSGNPLTEELRREILEIDGVKDVITTRQSIGTDFQIDKRQEGGMGDMITPDTINTLENALTAGLMPADESEILAADLYDQLKPGMKIQISAGKNAATVTVSGLISLSKCNTGFGHGDLQLDGAMVFLPEKLFQQLAPGIKNYDYSWDIISSPAKAATVKTRLQELLATHTELTLDTFSNQKNYIKSAYSTPFHILQGVALFISLFGMINLINTTLSNQISRRQETSILRSAGLTKKQLYHVLIYEGLCYAFLSMTITILAGLPLSLLAHHKISVLAYGAPATYHFPFLYTCLYALLLFLLEFILSAWTIRRQGKQSLVEQLRAL